ncbi:hypothetical protein AB0A73_24700 [Glycomyces sp. NPDC047369]
MNNYQAVQLIFDRRRTPEEIRDTADEHGTPDHTRGRVVDERLSSHTTIRWEWME